MAVLCYNLDSIEILKDTMARNEPYTTESFQFDYSCFLAAPTSWLKAEKAYIRLSILWRNPDVGTLDISKYIPREFSGYYYLIRSGAVVVSKPIEYQHQEVYFDRHIWTGEHTIQSTVSDLTTPDADIDSIDETSRAIGYTGGTLISILGNLNIPFLDWGFETLESALDAIASDALYYYPSPDRPDKIGFSIPDGLVDLRCEFGWIPYSDLMVLGGVAELPLEDLIEAMPPSELTGLGSTSNIKTLDEIAADNGYISESGLPAACSSAGFLDSSASLINAALNSSLSGQELLDELLANGYIFQSDIDAILADAPLLTPEGIVAELVRQGKITGQSLSGAISSHYAERPYNPTVTTIANIVGNPYKRWRVDFRITDTATGMSGIISSFLWSYHEPLPYVLKGQYPSTGNYYVLLVANAIFHSTGTAQTIQGGTRVIAANATATTPTANPFIGKVRLYDISTTSAVSITRYSYSVVDVVRV